MLGAPLPYLLAALGGLALLALGAGLVRLSGARIGIGRRLAGARGVRIGDLLDRDDPPARPVRVAGRIRCSQPLHTPDDDRLVAYHRDVEVRLPNGRWRRIERLRETRSFELWDHAGSLIVDPALAAEPLVTIPHRWEGDPAELDAAFRPALERLASEGRGAPDRARSETRMVSVTDRLLVLAHVDRGEGQRLVLRAPRGGYIISTLELDAAMRLLGGRRRRLLVAGAAAAAIGVGVLTLGLAMAALAWLAGG